MSSIEHDRDWSSELETHLEESLYDANRTAYKTRKGKDAAALHEARLRLAFIAGCDGTNVDADENPFNMPRWDWNDDERLPPDTFGDGDFYGE